MLRNDLTPMQYIIRFLDGDIERTHYTDDRRYYERLIAAHGHLTDLRIEPLTLAPEQQQRLDSLPAGLAPHDAGVYVRYGTAEDEDSPHYDPALIAAYHRDQAEPQVKAQRKAAEAKGVTVAGIRHAGDPSNRQALSEALQAAKDSNQTTFARWKCASGGFKANVPAADIEAAYRQIGKRRAALIDLETQHVESVTAGEADIYELDWSTLHD